MTTPEMPDRIPSAWRGKEVVQVIGHSAYGGGVPIVLGIMKALAEIDLRPVLLATHPDVVAAADDAGFDIWRFEGIVREPRPARDAFTSLRLARALRARGVSAIHTHTSKGGMVGRLAGRLAACPLVIHHTHGFYHTAMQPGLARTGMLGLERFFGRLTDYQVFLSEHAQALALAEGTTTAAKARVVQNGIDAPDSADPDFVRAMRREWGVPEGAQLIGSVCRLDARTKGLDSGVLALASIRREMPNVWWVIVGEGSDREHLNEYARACGVSDRVIMPGHLPDAGRLNACFDVAFAPSRREGQSVSIMEAMACGTAILTTRIPGNDGLVEDGVNSLLVDPDDVSAMAQALERLLVDTALASRVGAAAADRFQHIFTRDAFESRIKHLYMEAVAHVSPRLQ